MQMYLTIDSIIFLAAICSATALFQWLEYNDNFDCVAGITIDGKPAGIGVFISERDIVSSANPLQNYLTKEGNTKIALYVINGKYNEDKEYKVQCMMTMYAQDRRFYSMDHGTDGKHSPLHDLITINVLLESDSLLLGYGEAKKLRMPFRRGRAYSSDTIKMGKEFSFASFAYIDKQHVEESTEMEAEFMDSEVLENCHEWIPKDWGYFICISQDEDYIGIQAGTPLFHDDKVFGIASFSIKKMNRTILVFTDLRQYIYPLCRLT